MKKSLDRWFLIEREQCCGSGCQLCPYEPKHVKGSTIISPDTNKWNELHHWDEPKEKDGKVFLSFNQCRELKKSGFDKESDYLYSYNGILYSKEELKRFGINKNSIHLHPDVCTAHTETDDVS